MTDERTAAVLAAVDPEEVIALTRELVRINSVWDPAAGTGEQEAAERCADWARQRGFSVEMDEVAPGRPNAIVTLDGTKPTGLERPRCLMFEGHTDVVTPGDPEAEWSHDPFGAEIVGRTDVRPGDQRHQGQPGGHAGRHGRASKRSGVPLCRNASSAGVLCDEEDDACSGSTISSTGATPTSVTGADHLRAPGRPHLLRPRRGLSGPATWSAGTDEPRGHAPGRAQHRPGHWPGSSTAWPGPGKNGRRRTRSAGTTPPPGLAQLHARPSIRAPAQAGPPQLNVMPGQCPKSWSTSGPWPAQSHDEDQGRPDRFWPRTSGRGGQPPHYRRAGPQAGPGSPARTIATVDRGVPDRPPLHGHPDRYQRSR